VSSPVSDGEPARVIAWGSYDESKPRVRLLLDELRRRGALAAEINIPVWNSVRDKAVAGRATMLKRLLRLAAAYPAALAKLLRQPSGGTVLLAYPAIADIFALWPVARLRRHKIVFDAFISLHDTVVGDRRMLTPNSMRARLTWRIERRALRLADIILVDTDQHGEFFAREFGIPRDRFQTVLVGAEPQFWNTRGGAHRERVKSERPTILFYGQLIPLHGLDTILDAIRRTEADPIRWLLIGSGQEEPKLREFLEEHGHETVVWRPWVDYAELPALICSADVALGIFGTSAKAGRVIPNKAYQVLACGKPLITRESPAMEALAKRYPDAVRTVPPGDGPALAAAVHEAIGGLHAWVPVPAAAQRELGPEEGVEALLGRLR
jgi:glycosyltransferase involved in cell wall biosynthesis